MPKVRRTRTTFHYTPQTVSQEKEIERVIPGSARNINAHSLLASYSKEHKDKRVEEKRVEEKVIDKERSIPKKEKRKERHEKWLEKLGSIYRPKKKKKKQVESSGILADFSSLREILETLPDIASDPNHIPQRQLKPLPKGLNSKKVVGKKARKNAEIAEMKRFHKIMHHPIFKADPMSTIESHVKNSLGPKEDYKTQMSNES
ncbi:hypothetical protein G9A89_005179 [Geosiphon pyriformis]|nr:hypothetical protein G9A89_005179 [Geosiphon pyriformis]